MCLAIPARVKKITAYKALVEALGYSEEVDIRLVKDIKIGDFVLVHVGFAIQRIEPGNARELLDLYGTMNFGGQ